MLAHSLLRAVLHCHSPGVATAATVARRLRIDVHDDDDNNNDNDNAWQREWAQQLVSPEAQQRQCQSYTKNKNSYQTLIMLLIYRLTWKLMNLLLKKKCLQGVQKWLPITLLKPKLRSFNPFGNANLTNEDRRQIADESRQKLRVLTA